MAKTKGIKYSDDELSFGIPVYLVNDRRQVPHELVGIVLRSGHIKYLLCDSECNMEFEVWKFQISLVPDELKKLDNPPEEDMEL